MSETNKQVILRWIEALNTGNLELLDDIVKPDFVRHSEATPGVDVRSLTDFKEFDRESRAIFLDMRVEIEMLVAEGDKVAFWGKFSGIQTGPMGPHPALGKRLNIDIAGVFRFEGGKIAELWVTWDNLAGLAQLGHLPPS